MKRLFLIAPLLLVGVGGSAQNKFGFGVNAGPVISGAKVTTVSSFPIDVSMNPRLAFYAGAIVSYHISQNISLETGINMVGKGFSYSFTDGSSSAVDFAPEIPLLLGMRAKLNDKTYLKGFIGGAVNFQAGTPKTGLPEDTIGNYIHQDSLYYTIEDSTYYYGGSNFSIISGVGIEKELTKGLRLFFGVSYHYSFKKMYEGELTHYLAGESNFINSFESNGSYLSLDVRFLFGRKAKEDAEQ